VCRLDHDGETASESGSEGGSPVAGAAPQAGEDKVPRPPATGEDEVSPSPKAAEEISFVTDKQPCAADFRFVREGDRVPVGCLTDAWIARFCTHPKRQTLVGLATKSGVKVYAHLFISHKFEHAMASEAKVVVQIPAVAISQALGNGRCNGRVFRTAYLQGGYGISEDDVYETELHRLAQAEQPMSIVNGDPFVDPSLASIISEDKLWHVTNDVASELKADPRRSKLTDDFSEAESDKISFVRGPVSRAPRRKLASIAVQPQVSSDTLAAKCSNPACRVRKEQDQPIMCAYVGCKTKSFHVNCKPKDSITVDDEFLCGLNARCRSMATRKSSAVTVSVVPVSQSAEGLMARQRTLLEQAVAAQLAQFGKNYPKPSDAPVSNKDEPLSFTLQQKMEDRYDQRTREERVYSLAVMEQSKQMVVAGVNQVQRGGRDSRSRSRSRNRDRRGGGRRDSRSRSRGRSRDRSSQRHRSRSEERRRESSSRRCRSHSKSPSRRRRSHERSVSRSRSHRPSPKRSRSGKADARNRSPSKSQERGRSHSRNGRSYSSN
jgi:hypothetical protein